MTNPKPASNLRPETGAFSQRDRVTLENSAGDVVEDPNTDWMFQTYGPAAKPGQTFHDEYAERGFAGPRSEAEGALAWRPYSAAAL